MNELVVVLLAFLGTTGLFLSSTIYYRRRFLQEKWRKAIYMTLFIRLRDHGIEHVKKYLNMRHMIEYRDGIAKIDEQRARYRS